MSRYKRRYGDRKEGSMVRSIPPSSKFIPHIMPQRNDRLVNYDGKNRS